MEYIQPNLKKYDNLTSLLESKESFFWFEKNKFDIDDFVKLRNAFLVSEPGYGKTRLLKECLLRNEGIFIDLKRLGKQNIEDYITNSTIQILENSIYTESLDETKLFKTPKFTLKNDSEQIFCFDALDEVKQEDFSDVVTNIKNFINKNSGSRFIISCRKNYLSRWKDLFSEINFDYVEIFPLDGKKIKSFLLNLDVKGKKADELMDKFSFRDRRLILETPRYLEMAAKLIKEHGFKNFQNITRGELFEKFIYQDLAIESKKIGNATNVEIIKKVLEKLALIMEIYQTNQIRKDELMDFFDDTKSNLNITFLNQVPIEIFYERSLLKNNIDTVEFENTEFQEYLASKEILRLGRTEQVVFDLAIVKELGEVHPSWINTLTFLIEFDIELLKNILEYVFSNEQKTRIDEHIKLITRHNIEKLSIDDRQKIFKVVFSYYQEVAHWIDYDTAETLSYYFDKSLCGLIEKYINDKRGKDEVVVSQANLATIVAFLLEKNSFTPQKKSFWINFLKKTANKQDQNEAVLRRSLFALGKVKDLSIYTPSLIQKVLDTNNDPSISNLVYALEDIDPNHKKSLDVFLHGVRINNITARLGLYKVNSKDAIKYILDKFISDKLLVDQYIEHENTYSSEKDEFVESVKKNLDDEIVDKLKQIIINTVSGDSLYRVQKSNFIKELVLIIKSRTPDYIFELINTSDANKIFALGDVFAAIIEEKQIKRFIEEINTKNGSTWLAVQILQLAKHSAKNGEKIFKAGKKYLKHEYSKLEKNQKKYQADEAKRVKSIYEEFKFKLEPSKDKYYTDIFEFYFENHEKIKPFMKTEDKERLKKLTLDIFEKFDPGKQKLVINNRQNGSTTYTTSSLIHAFGGCLQVVKLLDIDTRPFRQKILNYIPFAYDKHREAIFDLVPDPTDLELKNVLSLYKRKKDDLTIFMPSSTIDFIKNYGIIQAIPLLKYFIKSKEISFYDKKTCLEIIAKISNNINEKKYLDAIFKKRNSSDKDEQALAFVANSILITKFADEDSIKWRFSELINRAFKFKRPGYGSHMVSEQESELHDKEFAKPLLSLKDIKYKDLFLKLLKDSFDIFGKGEDFEEYASYIWSIFIDYYLGLKELKNYDILTDIDQFIINNSGRKGLNWFCYKYQKLKLEYIIYIGKPQNISDCIKKYNFFKEKIYTEISTPMDLVGLIKRIVDNDLKKWVEDEGAYKFIEENRPKNKKIFNREDLIQKTIKVQFENSLLAAGLRKSDINIQRESQMLDNKRTDFLIYYGFIGPILIEIKLTQNEEITNKKKREKYRTKLLQYIKGTSSHYGVFIILSLDKRYNVESYLPALQNLYSKEKNLVKIAGLNCVK